MGWLQATWVVDADLVEALTAILEDQSALSVTCENAGDDEFYEVAFPGTPDWQSVKVSGLFPHNIEIDSLLESVQAQLTATRDGTQLEIPVTVAELKDQDWERVWLSSFKPVKVGKNLWVCPSWCEPTAPQARNIILDPGLAFGTGTHTTTRLCLAWLAAQNLDGQSVLDYGAGSGILAIAALLSGAEDAVAVDIDPLAVTACTENAQRNGLERSLHAYLPQQLPEGRYQLVIANILAEVIIDLRDRLLQHLAPQGTLLLTGILGNQAARVKRAFADTLEFEQIIEEQWCLLIGSRIPGTR